MRMASDSRIRHLTRPVLLRNDSRWENERVDHVAGVVSYAPDHLWVLQGRAVSCMPGRGRRRLM